MSKRTIQKFGTQFPTLAVSHLRFRAEPNLAEGRLKSALENKELVNVGVDGAGICGVAFRDPKYGWEVYSTDPLCVPALVKDTIATATLADDQKSTFWRDGYLVFPGMLAKEVQGSSGELGQFGKDVWRLQVPYLCASVCQTQIYNLMTLRLWP